MREGPVLYVLYSRVCCNGRKLVWYSCEVKKMSCIKPLLQPLRWCCVDCMIHHERDVREEQKCMYVERTSNYRVIPME